MTSPTPGPAPKRRRRISLLLLAGVFAFIAVANAVRAAIDGTAGASWVVAGLFGLGAICYLVAHLVERRAAARDGGTRGDGSPRVRG
ncbi:hypothetical protein [Clavibacter michiganensis]|uniref:hypothetical protein n=1 Tax=Clavibacter michiganensis TaxID=28447 RepID=UPI003EB9426B